MVETLFILILYMKGVPLEYMGHHDVRGQWQEMGMAGCLSVKRTLKRNGWRDTDGSGARYSCERRMVYVETGSDGRHRVMKIIE